MDGGSTGVGVRPWAQLLKDALVRHGTALTRKTEERAFWEVDAFAWMQGWQVRRRWHRHVYRDPLFDLLMSCSECAGIGRGCRSCGETGRVNRLDLLLAAVEPEQR